MWTALRDLWRATRAAYRAARDAREPEDELADALLALERRARQARKRAAAARAAFEAAVRQAAVSGADTNASGPWLEERRARWLAAEAEAHAWAAAHARLQAEGAAWLRRLRAARSLPQDEGRLNARSSVPAAPRPADDDAPRATNEP